MAAQAKQVFYVQNPCESRGSVVLQGKTTCIGHHIEASTLDVSEMPAFSQQMPFINAEDEEDDVHANRNDHEWIMVGEPAVGNVDEMQENAEVEAPQELAHQWSPFETLMIKKMDVMLHLHQEHSAKVHSSLENITTQLENIETRLTLSNLLNHDEDKA